MSSSSVVRALVGTTIGAIALVLPAISAAAEGGVSDPSPSVAPSPSPTVTCVVTDSNDDASGAAEASLQFDRMGGGGKSGGHGKHGDHGKSGNHGKSGDDHKVGDNDKSGKRNHHADACDRAARQALKEQIKADGGTWGAQMRRETLIRVLTRHLEHHPIVDGVIPQNSVLVLFRLIVQYLPANIDIASLFPPDFDLEAFLAALVIPGDGPDDVPSPAPSPSASVS